MADSNIMDKDLWRKREIVQVNGVWTVEGRPKSQYKLLDVRQPSNMPGMSYVAVHITAAPRAATPPHIHNGAAVYAQMISGRMLSQMIHPHEIKNDDGSITVEQHDSGVGVYEAGQIWYEGPGCRHVRAENASDETEATFYATFVIETAKLGDMEPASVATALTILDVDPRSPHYVGNTS